MGSIRDVTIQFRQRGMAILKEEGIAGLVKRIKRRLSRKPVHFSCYIVALSLDHSIRVPAPSVDVEIDQIKATDDNDLEMLVKFGEYGASKALFLQRFADGQRCYVAKFEGRIVSGNWVYEREWKPDDFGRRFKLADNEFYYDGAFTLPEYRGKGIISYLKAQSANDIKAHSQNKTRALAFILVSNKANLRSVAKVGFKRVGRVGWIEIFGIRVHYLLGRGVLPETTQRFFIERN
jgi:GNAT superfamily N-acetyltransferase